MSEGDPYLIPGTGVLQNILGVTTQAELDAIERRAVPVRAAELRVNPIAGRYDLAHLKAFHRRLFGDIYDWAGELRTVDIAKPPTLFCLVAHLASFAETTFDVLAAEPPLPKDRGLVAERVAFHLAEANALHPFREGNGRAQRAFFWQYAMEQGWEVRWEVVDPDENVAACEDAMRKDHQRLAALIEPLLAPVLVLP